VGAGQAAEAVELRLKAPHRPVGSGSRSTATTILRQGRATSSMIMAYL